MVKIPAANVGDMGSIPGPGKSHMLEQLSLWVTTTEPVLEPVKQEKPPQEEACLLHR